jgi:hypothetical protein
MTTPTITLPFTICGAMVMVKLWRKSSTVLFQTTPPVVASKATRTASSRPMNTGAGLELRFEPAERFVGLEHFAYCSMARS